MLTCGYLIVAFCHVLELEDVELILLPVHPAREQLDLILLRHFFILLSIVSRLLYFIVDLLELLQPLLNGGVELHSVLGCVAEGLL